MCCLCRSDGGVTHGLVSQQHGAGVGLGKLCRQRLHSLQPGRQLRLRLRKGGAVDVACQLRGSPLVGQSSLQHVLFICASPEGKSATGERAAERRTLQREQLDLQLPDVRGACMCGQRALGGCAACSPVPVHTRCWAASASLRAARAAARVPASSVISVRTSDCSASRSRSAAVCQTEQSRKRNATTLIDLAFRRFDPLAHVRAGEFDGAQLDGQSVKLFSFGFKLTTNFSELFAEAAYFRVSGAQRVAVSLQGLFLKNHGWAHENVRTRMNDATSHEDVILRLLCLLRAQHFL
jgi:hypothetical protein